MTVPIRWRVVVAGADLATAGLSGSVSWGRDDLDAQPDASTCSITFDDPAASIATGVEIGDDLDVIAVVAGVESPRFAGTIVDVTLDHAAETTTLAAAGELSRLARFRVGDTPWPAELDGDRMLRILDLADVDVFDPTRWVDVDPGVSWAGYGPGSWRTLRAPTVPAGDLTIRARDVDSQPVSRLLADTAASARGVVYERRDGTIAYAPRSARTRAVDVPASAAAFLDAATFTRSTSTLLNSVEVEYGDPPPDSNERPTFVVSTDPGPFGRFARKWTTDLAVEAEARTIAEAMMYRRTSPAWALDVLTFDTDVIDDPETVRAIMAAELGDTARIEGIGPPTPAAVADVVIEGAVEAIEPGRWSTAIRCTDARLSVVGESWAEHGALDPGRRWAMPAADGTRPAIVATRRPDGAYVVSWSGVDVQSPHALFRLNESSSWAQRVWLAAIAAPDGSVVDDLAVSPPAPDESWTYLDQHGLASAVYPIAAVVPAGLPWLDADDLLPVTYA